LFASPFIHNDSQFDSNIALLFPQASGSALSAIEQTLYPANFDGSFGYTNQLGRMARVIADATTTCNTYFMNKVFKDSFAYQFSVPPAWHANDLGYTFMDPSNPEAGVNITLAVIMQRYFASFVTSGSPNPVRGGFLLDAAVNASKCDWWQEGNFV
jgi:cholinesterase